MNDPTYDRDEIRRNPVWELAFVLSEIQNDGAPLIERTLLFRQLASIVAHAHRLSPPIVHRDLKPSNILVSSGPSGVTLKIADFGIGGIAATQALDPARNSSTTGGFLLGFVPAAALVGYVGREPGWWRTLAAATGGTVLVFACGVPWLGLYLGINLEQAVRLGLLPFVLDAALKIAVAVAAVQAVRHCQNPPMSQTRRGGSSGGPLT